MERRENPGTIVWRLIYPLLMFLGAEILVEVGMIMVYVVTHMNSLTMDPEVLTNNLMDYVVNNSMILAMIRGIILIPLFIMFMYFDQKRLTRTGRAQNYTGFGWGYLLVLPFAGSFAALGFNNLIELSGIIDLSPTYQQVEQAVYGGGMWVSLLSAVVIAPVLEELLFRGLLYQRLRENSGPLVSMLISAALFGLIHGNLVQFVYAFLIGLLLAYVYEKFKTIWAPIIFHGSANLLSVVVTWIFSDASDHPITIGTFMIITVLELAATALLLLIIEKKVNREVKTNV